MSAVARSARRAPSSRAQSRRSSRRPLERRPAGDRGRPRRPPAARLPHAHRPRRRSRRSDAEATQGRASSTRYRRELTPLSTVGTAGHIDHGKTWLVRALTGRTPTDCPRSRGADLDRPRLRAARASRRPPLSVIDVPGHERFVRTMVAGATGIDLFLLVSTRARAPASDPRAPGDPSPARNRAGSRRGHEGRRGGHGRVELVVEEARELVPGAEVVAVSAKTGDGLDELRAALGRRRPRGCTLDRATRIVGRPRSRCAARHRRHGTLWSGSSARETAAGRALGPATCASQRPGARPRRRARRSRGSASPSAFRASSGGRSRAERRWSSPARTRSRYGSTSRSRSSTRSPTPRVSTFTSGQRACRTRLVAVGERWASSASSSPVVAAQGDRVILRGETTVGGGIVLDPAPPRHATGAPHARAWGRSLPRSRRRSSSRRCATFRRRPRRLLRAGPWVFSAEWLAEPEDEAGRIAAADADRSRHPLRRSRVGRHRLAPGARAARRQALPPGRVASLAQREAAATTLEATLEPAGARRRSRTPSSLASSRRTGGSSARRRLRHRPAGVRGRERTWL